MTSEIKADVKQEIKLSTVDDEDIDELQLHVDESSNQSWGTRTNIWEKKEVEVKQEVKQG